MHTAKLMSDLKSSLQQNVFLPWQEVLSGEGL